MTDIELMMERGMLKVLYFCQDCPKRSECDKRISPCCDNFLGYRLTVEKNKRRDGYDESRAST